MSKEYEMTEMSEIHIELTIPVVTLRDEAYAVEISGYGRSTNGSIDIDVERESQTLGQPFDHVPTPQEVW